MSQSRHHSFLEALLNTASGFLVSYLAWPIVCCFVLHMPFRAGPGIEVIAVFTVVSIARNYLWRRIFNRHRRCPAEGGIWPCPEHLVGTEPGCIFSDGESAAAIERLRAAPSLREELELIWRASSSLEPTTPIPCAYPGCMAPDGTLCRHWPRDL